jgi:hypothetical protein
MTTREKIKYLNSLGIPFRTLAKYCNYNETHISKYAKGIINVSEKCSTFLESGLKHFIEDIEVINNE